MVAVDAERDGQRHERRTAEERPKQQTPVMKPFATEDAEADAGPDKRQQLLPTQRAADLRWPVLAQKRADSPVVRSRRIDVTHELPEARAGAMGC
jgi:hypothetical protein